MQFVFCWKLCPINNDRLHMHPSLKPKTNIRLIVVWALIAVSVAVISSPIPWLFLGLGVVLGTCADFIQLLALCESSRSLLVSETAMDVRRALSSSRWGRRYLYTLWFCVVLLFLLAFYFLRSRAVVGLFASYSAFAFMRELLTLRGTFELERLSTEQSA